ncbi:MAG: hypothetical protein JWR60_2781 [Polaromonas sp.]|nr:hypothetical protein [Polaromonas sp.]
MFRLSILTSATLALTLGLAACGGSGDSPTPTPAPTPVVTVPVGDAIALTVSGRLTSFNRTTPGTQVGTVAVTGLAGGETLLGIDVRPANGALYALGSNGGIYRVDPATGVATLSSTLRAATGDDNPFTALSGTSFGIDFNPVADRLRVVSDTGQNLRINVETGDAITDGAVSPAGAAVSASAYTNAFPGTTSTRLFSLNLGTGTLDLQDPPNSGTQVGGPPLGVTATGTNGFDIDGRTNTGYAALTVGGTTSLYRINLAAAAPAAAATLVGGIAGGEAIRGLALVQPTRMNAVALLSGNRLAGFDPRTPNTLTSDVAITGMEPNECMLGIDVRPADGQLWGLTCKGRLYTLNPDTGAATFRAALAADPADTTAPFTGLDGSLMLSVDFNPVADRMRIITPAGQSLRINVATGATTTDGTINRASAPASVVAAAYGNNFAGTTATTLYDLDANADVLAIQSPPNDGTLANVGALNIDITSIAGLDIAGGDNGLVLAALRAGTTGPFLLHTISLATGAATPYLNTSGTTLASQIGGANGPVVLDLAIRP